ncbi:hypothetical protein M422DRAFT_248338 [Sphaerobolus stellatus SS14]|uniref:Uncharacterized protein n=1 Tax=Sphaerobolus stellatus (strain SS14) TaxID=990650 RepID=A0A0C9VIM3_SPHS4|nr:hypothetical protein M422DRAFT_259988 [Sphaerobolus stellatus SS14]KIJ47774.1 hypothetical protein M422DRAFT_248338 [Sphaerobolus stellatus SS14]
MKDTENITNRRPYCAEDLKGFKATALSKLIKDDPRGKWPEEQYGRLYDSRLPTISVMKNFLYEPNNGYTCRVHVDRSQRGTPDYPKALKVSRDASKNHREG